MSNLYPLKFRPILKSIIWGGDQITEFKGIVPRQNGIGESWEVSAVKDNVSVVSNGAFEGKLLDEMIASFGASLLGQRNVERFGAKFPLLIKFIDARDDLSIQVHPDDRLAKERHNSFGKTEMWYVVKAQSGAGLYSGFSKQIDADKYVELVENNTITDVLQRYEVKPGDLFFLPAGRVHAIGAGTFIAEIQQNSDITYRIYDYDRRDAAGNGRELHTELAKDAIDYTVEEEYRTFYQEQLNQPVFLVESDYFTTNLLHFDKPMERDIEKIDSFVIYICMEGGARLTDNNGYSIELRQGETALIPAQAKGVTLHPDTTCKILETFVL